jgi:hypothetical protein
MHILSYRLYPHQKGLKIRHEYNEWFMRQKIPVPPNTLRPERYKKFCMFQAEQTFTPCPSLVAPRSKLMNYYVMRCLDQNWEKHVTSAELQRFVSTIRKFVEQCKYHDCEIVLHRFCGGGDAIEGGVTDSSVLLQILCAAVDESIMEKDEARVERLSEMCNKFLGVLNEDDRAKAISYVESKT